MRISGGEEYLAQLLDGRVIGKGDLITINVMNRKIDLVITKIEPQSDAVIFHPTSSTSNLIIQTRLFSI